MLRKMKMLVLKVDKLVGFGAGGYAAGAPGGRRNVNLKTEEEEILP